MDRAAAEQRLQQTHEKLKEYRTRTDLKLKRPKYLRETCVGLDGVERLFALRYYQVQMVLHLHLMRRFVIGDDTGLGKTVEIIAALCCRWEKEPSRPAIILTTKSATPQWADEMARFTEGVSIFVARGLKAHRKKVYKQFLEAEGPKALILGYKTATRDISILQRWTNHILVTDEATAYKNMQTEVFQTVSHLANSAWAVWAATATLIKNNLMEGYSIFRVVYPGLFLQEPDPEKPNEAPRSMNATQFLQHYTIYEMMEIPKSSRKVPKIVGYSKAKIHKFRDIISPFYLGRPKHEVASELPALTIKRVPVTISPAQDVKYTEALVGVLEVGDARDDGQTELKETTKLTQITYCQQIVNDLALIECEGDSPKVEALLDLLKDDYEGQNVIIFTRFRRMVDRLIPLVQKVGRKCVRVTGDEDQDERSDAMRRFQSPNEPENTIFITMAGGDAINLQSASVLIFFDTPWSAGDYLQILGRMIRIGSIHDRCLAVHLIAERLSARGRKNVRTVDHRVMGVLDDKMELLEEVLGKRLKGTRQSLEDFIGAIDETDELFLALQADAMGEVGVEPPQRKAKGKGKGKGKKTSSPPTQAEAVSDEGADDLMTWLIDQADKVEAPPKRSGKPKATKPPPQVSDGEDGWDMLFD